MDRNKPWKLLPVIAGAVERVMSTLIQNWSPHAFVVSTMAFVKAVDFAVPIAVVMADIFNGGHV